MPNKLSTSSMKHWVNKNKAPLRLPRGGVKKHPDSTFSPRGGREGASGLGVRPFTLLNFQNANTIFHFSLFTLHFPPLGEDGRGLFPICTKQWERGLSMQSPIAIQPRQTRCTIHWKFFFDRHQCSTAFHSQLLGNEHCECLCALQRRMLHEGTSRPFHERQERLWALRL